MEKEQWKTITHDIRYEISNFGRVRNKKSGHILSCKPTKSHRHPQVFLAGNFMGRLQLTVSQLVWHEFNNQPYLYGKKIGHKDGNILNNHVENLYLKTCKGTPKHIDV